MPPLWRRRRFRRWLYIASTAIIIACGWWFGPAVYERLRFMYWEHRCLNFSPPPGTVVYQRLPAGSNVAAPAGYFDVPKEPHLLSWLQAASPAMTEFPFAPRCWDGLRRSLKYQPLFWQGDPVVFCHELRSPSGHVRLVTIGVLRWIGLQTGREALWVYDEHGKGPWRASQLRGLSLPGPSMVEAGQPDPMDASHFTIAYQWPDGVRGIIDGWLQDDDDVKLSVRPGLGDVESENARLSNH